MTNKQANMFDIAFQDGRNMANLLNTLKFGRNYFDRICLALESIHEPFFCDAFRAGFSERFQENQRSDKGDL